VRVNNWNFEKNVIRDAVAEAASDNAIASDFRKLGVRIEGPEDLVKRDLKDSVHDPHQLALLAHHLEQNHPHSILQIIARTLGSPQARPYALQPLLRMTYKYRDHVIGQTFMNAVERMAKPEDAEWIAAILMDRSVLSSVLLVPVYVKFKKKDSLPVLEQLLDTDEKGSMLVALRFIGNLKLQKLRSRVEQFTKDEDGDIRREATKALKKINTLDPTRGAKRIS
jgi:hypothetical protein